MVAVAGSPSLTYHTSTYLRQRLVLATLSSRPVKFTNIRKDESKPGLCGSEVSFIRLLDKLTSGTIISINDTGTSLYYKPGILIGGRISHECHAERAISYYLQPLLMLAPFCKHALQVTFKGVTHSTTDISMDSIAAVSIPLLRRLTLGSELSPAVDVQKRSLTSKANGEGKGGVVTFSCGVTTQKLKPIDLLDCGFIKRIRGLAFANRVSATVISEMIDTTRGLLNDMLADVYIHTDHSNKGGCGAGFGIQLVAESSSGCLVGSDWMEGSGSGGAKVATKAVEMLLEEIEGGGCVDSWNVCMALGFCAMAQEDVSRVRVGGVSESVVAFVRDLYEVWGVKFASRDGHDGDGVVMSCVGIGVHNSARQRF